MELGIPVVVDGCATAIHLGKLIRTVAYLLCNLEETFPLGHEFRHVFLLYDLLKD